MPHLEVSGAVHIYMYIMSLGGEGLIRYIKVHAIVL
jgi:hypothetical protein